jgi:hypothetical protein
VLATDVLRRGLACECTCPVCEEAVIAKKGRKYRHHFAHRGGSHCSVATGADGAGESLLHALAKQAMVELKEFVLPPLRHKARANDDRGHPHVGVAQNQNELLRFRVHSASKEVWSDGFQPDVVLEGDQGTLFVEIAVTHYVDVEKLAKLRARGVPTLEVSLAHLDQSTQDTAEIDDALADVGHMTWLYHPDEQKLKARAQSIADWHAQEANKRYAEEDAAARAAAEEDRRLQEAAVAERRQRDAEIAAEVVALVEKRRLAEEQAHRERVELERATEERWAAERAARAAKARDAEIEANRAHAEARRTRDEKVSAELEARYETKSARRRAQSEAAARLTTSTLNVVELVELTRLSEGAAPAAASTREQMTVFLSEDYRRSELQRLDAEALVNPAWEELQDLLGAPANAAPTYLDVPVADELAFRVHRRVWQALFYAQFVLCPFDSTEKVFPLTVNEWLTKELAPLCRQVVTKDLDWLLDSDERKKLPNAQRALTQYIEALCRIGDLECMVRRESYRVTRGPNVGFWLDLNSHG